MPSRGGLGMGLALRRKPIPLPTSPLKGEELKVAPLDTASTEEIPRMGRSFSVLSVSSVVKDFGHIQFGSGYAGLSALNFYVSNPRYL